NEAFWRARMEEIGQAIASLRNGRDKLVLYHRYIRGESVERAAAILGISRRTAYRAFRRGLTVVGIRLERMARNDPFRGM
ncbi:MAG: helix-turn-helix domain-containing protein, partial [Eubacteriales bacterium]|nr:helix-turn-helix domain-containing protein [Eubacteriales bacterium]